MAKMLVWNVHSWSKMKWEKRAGKHTTVNRKYTYTRLLHFPPREFRDSEEVWTCQQKQRMFSALDKHQNPEIHKISHLTPQGPLKTFVNAVATLFFFLIFWNNSMITIHSLLFWDFLFFSKGNNAWYNNGGGCVTDIKVELASLPAMLPCGKPS